MRTRAVLRLLAVFIAFVFLAASCGDDTATAPTTTDSPTTALPETTIHDDDHDHDETEPDGSMPMDDHADDHHDATTEVTSDVIPTVAIDVTADAAGGVNIHVTSTGIDIAPEAASTEAVEGQGHYHLYVDGEKVLRFYNDWIHYSGVTEGEAEITVELSANDHSAYVVDGVPIAATVVFDVPEHAHDAHSHDDPEPQEFVGAAPTLTVDVVPDPKQGWNAFLTVDGMSLSPEHAGSEHVDGEGHLHIYANGQKIGRLYGLATHIPALPDGDVEITVAAYTNDHRPYVVDGVPLEVSATVEVAS